jgi:hypothetical protein
LSAASARVAAVLLMMSRCWDLERALAGLQILLRDVDFGRTHGEVALLPLGLGDPRQRGQALGVERIVGVEVLRIGLVELGERGALQLQAVQLEVPCHGGLHGLHEVGALFLQIGEGHGRGDAAQRVDEFRLDQLAQLLGIVGAIAQGLRGERDRSGVRLHAHIEFDTDVDAHAVLGDHRLGRFAADVEAQGLQIDPGDVVEHRHDERSPIEDHLLSAGAGADIGSVLLSALIELAENHADDEENKESNDDNEADADDVHGFLPSGAASDVRASR